MGSVQFILMLAVFAIGATLLLVSLAVLLFILWRRPAQPESKPLDLIIDVASLDASGPSGEVPQLTYLGKPVRLAAIVVAPVGRSGTIPEADRLLDAVDQLIPGLVDVISRGQVLAGAVEHAWIRPRLLSQREVARRTRHRITLVECGWEVQGRRPTVPGGIALQRWPAERFKRGCCR